jgi:hypothetical protein
MAGSLPRMVNGTNSALATQGKKNKSHPLRVKGKGGQRRRGTNAQKKG